MAAKAAGLDFEDFHKLSATADNYAGEKDCLAVWNSIDDCGGITSATLFGMALQQGWRDPSKTRHTGTNVPRNTPLPHARSERAVPNRAKQVPDAVEIWGRCRAITPGRAYSHAYIFRKNGKPKGVRECLSSSLIINEQNVAGYLVVPCWDGDKLQTLQFIPPDKGEKLNLPGASFNNGYFTVGTIIDRAYIVEGIGQAWAVNEATADAAVVCFGAARMATVAKTLRKKYPSAQLVVVPDRSKEEQAAGIAAAVSGQLVTMPTDMPDNYDVNDYAIDFGYPALTDLLTRANIQQYPLNVAFADELPNRFTPPDEILEGILTAGDGSVVYGESNCGKTFLVLDLACAIARGVAWMGRRTEPGLVIYLAAESPSSVSSRLQAYQRHYGVKVPNFAIVKSHVDLFGAEDDADKVIQLVRQLEAQNGQRVRLIVGDTLARLSAGSNENSGQDMGQVVRRVDRIRTECNAHFLLIHHSGKTASAGARGWSGLKGAVDTEIEVSNSAAGRCMEITKQRDLSTKGVRIGFKLEQVELGVNKWRSLATSCVVVPTDAPVKETGKRLSDIGGAIMELLSTKEQGMKKRDVVKHFDGQYDSSSVYREITHLTDAGKVSQSDGTVTAVTNRGAKGAD